MFLLSFKKYQTALAKHEICLKLALPDLDKRKLFLKVKSLAFRK
jgi:hypothetical protein